MILTESLRGGLDCPYLWNSTPDFSLCTIKMKIVSFEFLINRVGFQFKAWIYNWLIFSLQWRINFMHFFGNFWQNRMLATPLPPEGWRPFPWGILDPPPHFIQVLFPFAKNMSIIFYPCFSRHNFYFIFFTDVYFSMVSYARHIIYCLLFNIYYWIKNHYFFGPVRLVLVW